MTQADATVVIKGRNDLGYAIKSAEGQLRGLLKTGELVGKLFRGGAILGAAFAFERLAENAQKAAEKIGDKGTARALKQLNSEIDKLKSKGLNVIGRVLGDAYILAAGDDIDRTTAKIRNLREQIQAIERAGTGRRMGGAGLAALRAQLQDETNIERLMRDGPYAPLGSAARSRAVSRGGGSEQLVRTGAPAAPGRVDPMAGLGEVAIWQREIFSLGNAQRDALAKLSEETNREVSADLQQLTNETTKMLGTMSDEWRAASSEWAAFTDEAFRGIQSSLAEFLFDPFAEGLDGMLKGFVDTIRKMVAELVAQQALRAFFTWASGVGGGVGSFFTQLAGARASGGPVSGGRPYMVGERGPEMFVPTSSGSIVPNHALGGVTLNYTIDARGADAERIMTVLPGLLKRTKDETVAAVLDLSRRGRLA